MKPKTVFLKLLFSFKFRTLIYWHKFIEQFNFLLTEGFRFRIVNRGILSVNSKYNQRKTLNKTRKDPIFLPFKYVGWEYSNMVSYTPKKYTTMTLVTLSRMIS